jgi:hypothetical protein
MKLGKLALLGLTGGVLLWTGCSTREKFHPEKVEVKTLPSKSSPFLYDYTKNRETFRKGGLFFKNEYLNDLGEKLGDFKMVGARLAGRGNLLKDLDTNRTYTLPAPVVTASKGGGMIAFLLTNNGYGLLNPETGKIEFFQVGEESFSGTYLEPPPLFYHNLVVFPLLSGDIIFYDLNLQKVVNRFTIATGDQPFNRNIIYLSILNDYLYAATPSKIFVFAPHYYLDYKDDIKHIIDDGTYIYLFTVDGRIIKFGEGLKKLKSVKLKFAEFYAPTICNGKIYTIEKGGGYLIEIDPQTLSYRVWDGTPFNTSDPLRLRGCKIYNGKTIYFLK